ncbi:hypothetical protein BD309DRAFT_617361 [Dichomitus squalens]|nr:hypothetical protein BD309DRAFT_617361 [Dichomitus squalens]
MLEKHRGYAKRPAVPQPPRHSSLISLLSLSRAHSSSYSPPLHSPPAALRLPVSSVSTLLLLLRSVAAKPAKLSQADELDRAGSPSRSKLSRDPASWAPTPWPGPSHGLTCKLTFQIWQDVACADSELSIIVPSVVTTWYTCTEHNTTCA